MYIVCDTKYLDVYGFKEYKDGYSKKMNNGFLDISFQDLVIKKVYFDGNQFVYVNETGENIKDLIRASIVKKYEEET